VCYDIKNPFFMNGIKLKDNKLAVGRLKDILGKDPLISDNTTIGYVANTFENDKEINELKPGSVKDFFEKIDSSLKTYYNG